MLSKSRRIRSICCWSAGWGHRRLPRRWPSWSPCWESVAPAAWPSLYKVDNKNRWRN